MRMRMLTGLSGPHLSLAPGDEHDFDDREADRLRLAGFAKPAQIPSPTYGAWVSAPGAGEMLHDLAFSYAAVPTAEAAVEPATEVAPPAVPAPASRRKRKA